MTRLPTVIGFRGWRPTRDGMLRALAHRDVWQPGPNRSRCARAPISRPRCQDGPTLECACGLYAYHDLERALGRGRMHGVVAGWGRTIVHPGTWRAQFAQVLALVDDDGDPRLLRDLAVRYRVALVPIDEALAYGLEFGLPVPEELRPRRVEAAAG
jgi:hypothetical protein